jgi:nitroreductase
MDLFEAIQKRRSIRKFLPDPFPHEAVQKALEAAVLAPNSSNTQIWDFHWVRNPEMKQKLVHACMNQSAARTASQLVVVTTDPAQWRRSQAALIQWVDQAKAPSAVRLYYEKLIPLTYRWGPFNLIGLIKWTIYNLTGVFRPMMRGPNTKRDLQEIGIKSAALAAQNFVLAITAQGGATCMMEGFDESRVRKLLKLSSSSRVVMVLGIGFEAPRGTWGPQFRLPLEQVVHIYD